MTIVRVAFYVYWKKLINALIAGWTWLPNIGTPPASHVELGVELDVYDLAFIDMEYPELRGKVPDKPGWWFFSSTMRDGSKGCRWIWHEDLFKYKERWMVKELKYWTRPKKVMVESCCNLVGRGYDIPGIFGFIIPFGFNDKNKFYCSECVFKILFGFWKKLISPRRLFRKLDKVGAKNV